MMDILPWIMSAITIYMTVLAGNKHRFAWVVGLFNQALWLVWIVSTETWGLVPMNIALWIVYGRNHMRWIADREKGSTVAPDRPVTPKDTAAQEGRQLLGQASNPPELRKIEGRGALVQHLEELLQQVRDGDVDALAIASIENDGTIGHGWSYMDSTDQPWALLLAAVTSLQHDLLENGC